MGFHKCINYFSSIFHATNLSQLTSLIFMWCGVSFNFSFNRKPYFSHLQSKNMLNNEISEHKRKRMKPQFHK